MKRVILAMSYNRSNLAAWIEDHAYPLMECLAQLYLFPNCTATNHWRGEVWAQFHQMRKLKPSNKLPNPEFIYKNSWSPNKEFTNTAIRCMLEKESGSFTPIDNYSVEEYTEICEQYFTWLAKILSKYPAITKEDVYAELKKLGL